MINVFPWRWQQRGSGSGANSSASAAASAAVAVAAAGGPTAAGARALHSARRWWTVLGSGRPARR